MAIVRLGTSVQLLLNAPNGQQNHHPRQPNFLLKGECLVPFKRNQTVQARWGSSALAGSCLEEGKLQVQTRDAMLLKVEEDISSGYWRGDGHHHNYCP